MSSGAPDVLTLMLIPRKYDMSYLGNRGFPDGSQCTPGSRPGATPGRFDFERGHGTWYFVPEAM